MPLKNNFIKILLEQKNVTLRLASPSIESYICKKKLG